MSKQQTVKKPMETNKTAEAIKQDICYLPDGRFKGTSCIVPAMIEFTNQQTSTLQKENESKQKEIDQLKAKLQEAEKKIECG